jgi:hypothetical protein
MAATIICSVIIAALLALAVRGIVKHGSCAQCSQSGHSGGCGICPYHGGCADAKAAGAGRKAKK